MAEPDPVAAASTGPMLLGWREWVSLPALTPCALKAKLDTGARSSSLHVDALDEFERDGAPWLRFTLRVGRSQPKFVTCEAPSTARRAVTDTGGRRTLRWFIRTRACLAGQEFDIDVNLANRRHLLFPLLLGRSALEHRFAVDPARSYTQPRPARIPTSP